ARRVELAIATMRFRALALDLALLGEKALLPEPWAAWSRDLALRPDRLPGLLGDEKARKEAAKDLSRLAPDLSDSAAHAAGTFSAALKAYKEKDPCHALELPREQAHQLYAKACVAAACELWLDKSLERVRRALEPRSGKEAEGGIEGEYAAGRLYRIGVGAA